MSTRLRQIALVAEDLEPAVALLCEALGAVVVERDDGVASFGLHNALIQVGDCFIEVVSPLPGTALKDTSGGRYINKFGDGGYMVMVQVPSLAVSETSVADLKSIYAGGRAMDGHTYRKHKPGSAVPHDGITGTHYHPKDFGCIIEIGQMNPAEAWHWAGTEWRAAAVAALPSALNALPSATSRHGGLAGVEIAVRKDPAAVCSTWLRGMPGLRRVSSSSTELMTTDGAFIKFRSSLHAKEDGPVRVDLWTNDNSLAGSTTIICGVTFAFVQMPPEAIKAALQNNSNHKNSSSKL